jgi:hypothetical protein
MSRIVVTSSLIPQACTVARDVLRVGRELTFGTDRSLAQSGYSRRVVSGSSAIAKPVRVAPIPKLIPHVPTNISITASGAGL